MSKTKEELDQLKLEYESFLTKLKELSDEELEMVTGGTIPKEKTYFVGVNVEF